MIKKSHIGHWFIQVLLVCSGMFFSNAQAQTYGNEWIVDGQSYYKLSLWQTGVYGVSFSELSAAGVPASYLSSPQNLQLFHRGVEQAVLINNDSLIFFGQRNDGTLDSLLYKTPSLQPHKYYNLYSDTTAYFLTWSASASGKRMAVSNLSAAVSPEVYHKAEVLKLFTNEYDQGYRYSAETFMTYGDQGEGWFSGSIREGNQVTHTLNISNTYASGPVADFEIMLVGKNGYENSFNHLVDVLVGDPSNPDVSFSVPPFLYHDTKIVTGQIPLTSLTGSSVTVTVRNLQNNDGHPSLIAIAYMKLTYPQTFQMSGSERYFQTLANGSVSNIEISSPSTGAVMFDLTDKNNIQLVNTTLASGLLKATLAASASGHKLLVVSPSVFLKAPLIRKVDLADFSNSATVNYVIISHEKLMTGAREYAAYRASNAGGAYDTLLVDVNKLYNLYSYGERTPVAIRRFLTELFDLGDPKYLFIIGKGLSVNYNDYRSNPYAHINHSDPERKREDLVPCFGVPCSDLLFSMGLNGKVEHVAALATGRLPAKSNDEVGYYLDKVIESESSPDALWRKNVIHLSGGKTNDERTDFYNHMMYLKNIAEDTVYAAKVAETFSKKGNDAVSNELISSVAEQVNKGVSYVTFLGHSAPGITDLDIGFVSQEIYGYNNKGKYPMLMINGCSAALMFTRWSFAEDWILTPNKGAILTLGHSDAGYPFELKSYSIEFYKNAFQERSLAGKPIGDVQLATMESFYQKYAAFGTLGPVAITTLQQMIIQGDPAVNIYRPELPDYATDDNQLSIKSIDNKGLVTAVSDSFAISIIVSNLGLDFGDSLQISVERTIGDQVTMLGPVTYKHVSYQDTLLFVIRSKDASTYGLNTFKVILDPDNFIPESEELNNNTAVITYFMPLSGVIPLYPKEYSIVNTGTLTFIAQSTNLMVSPTNYFIELDTSYLFNSSSLIRKSAVINSGSLIKWSNITLPLLKDSLVYFWRVRYNDIALGQDTLWGESSFIYIDQSPEGWSQTVFPQFFKDEGARMIRDTTAEEWNYTTSSTEIGIKTVGTSVPSKPLFPAPYHNTTIRLNGFTYEFRGVCYNNSLFTITFDKSTVVPYSPYSIADGGATCGNQSGDIVNYFTNLGDIASPPNTPATIFNGTDVVPNNNMANFTEYLDRVPSGDYVVFGNSGNAYFDSWPASLKNRIKTEYGAQLIDSAKNGRTYLLVAKKGDPNPIFEDFGYANEELIYRDTLYGFHNTGYVTSTLIGPAVSWTTLYRKVEEQEASDTFSIKIIGVDIEGNHKDTLEIIQKDSLDLNTVNGLDQYPYIKLLAEVQDKTLMTPPQLKEWQVIFGGVPEGIMNPSLVGLSAYNTVTKPEGDSISICYAFENISDYDFLDTLQVKYTIVNNSTGTSSQLVKLTKLKRDTLITFCHKFSTKGFVGSNVLQAYVNPKILKEEYYNNNIVEMSFNVIKDNTHPILDVVFDGVHIMDGDIVSPSPMITVTLNDENRYLIRDSWEDIEIFLQKPGETTPQKVDFNNSQVINARQVGGANNNSYQIDYNPQNLPDGIYTLVVRGKDLSENPSGLQDYRITFEVINESAITNFYPYPNPFSTSTRFVFTLTGSEVPQDLKIQIMTVTGKVVREITKAELGPIRIGNNKTEYAWDGTDEFGDKLANGVYLYRVVIKGGEDFKHRETGGDKAFHKSFGKLYILR